MRRLNTPLLLFLALLPATGLHATGTMGIRYGPALGQWNHSLGDPGILGSTWSGAEILNASGQPLIFTTERRNSGLDSFRPSGPYSNCIEPGGRGFFSMSAIPNGRIRVAAYTCDPSDSTAPRNLVSADTIGVPLYVPTGIFIGSIEEGARIFTPVRLLPYYYDEATGHEFPTVTQLHRGEFETLVLLGEHAGYKLANTLKRYPTEPDTLWSYWEFDPPPVDSIRAAQVTVLPDSLAPIPGLKAVIFIGRAPVSFIVDTRDLSLEARGMDRATAMGLDISRAAFLEALAVTANGAAEKGVAILVYQR